MLIVKHNKKDSMETIDKLSKALETANNKASLKNWRLISIKKTATDFLFITLSQVKENEFATHIYNTTDNSFYLGHYITSKAQAWQNFDTRN